MSDKITGLVAAPHTPMHEDGAINLDVVERQAEGLVLTGVVGAFICGTTGEGVSLTVPERMALAQRWAQVTRGTSLKLIVHVGHNCLAEAQALAAHASEQGADGVAFMGTTFFKPTDVASLVDLCAPVAAAGAPLPFYYYHIPGLTGIRVSMAEFLDQGSRRIPTLRGVKYTEANLFDLQRCLALEEGRFQIFFGGDEVYLGAMAVGARAAVGSTYNYAAPNYLKMIAAYEAGDMSEARRCSHRAVALVEALLDYGVIVSGKALMSRVGVDCGPVRWPLARLTDERKHQLFERVESTGVLG